jgi:hypothetical protein
MLPNLVYLLRHAGITDTVTVKLADTKDFLPSQAKIARCSLVIFAENDYMIGLTMERPACSKLTVRPVDPAITFATQVSNTQ